MSIQISQIYARFSPATDKVFRQAMVQASRHRVVRAHHLIVATGETASGSREGQTREPATPLPSEWLDQARRRVEQDPTGCLDSPMTNSPTTRRILSLAHDRAAGDLILPSHLLAMTLCCWGEERPPGQVARQQISTLCQTLGVRPLPAFDSTSARPDAESEVDLERVPTARELGRLIGRAVTGDDLIDLYLAMKNTSDPAEKARLARRLQYLQDRG